MSHFCVYVFTDTDMHDKTEVDELLAPYNEQDESFFEFVPLSEDEIKVNMEFGSYASEEEMIDDYNLCRDKNGHICTWENQNAKWDWYQIGGRWKNGIKKADGTFTNQCRVCEMENNPLRPFAMVTSDGVWDECGQMGWFAISDATDDSKEAFNKRFQQYVKEHPQEIVTVVDCHI